MHGPYQVVEVTPTVTSIAGKRVYTSKDDIICVQLPDVPFWLFLVWRSPGMGLDDLPRLLIKEIARR